MRKAARNTLLIVAAVLTSLTALAAPSATDLLRKSYESDSKAIYSGELRTSLPGQTSSQVRVLHLGPRSRMEYLSGPSEGSVIIDTGKSIISLDSRTKTAYVSNTPAPPERLDLLLANHSPVLKGSGKIAGRDCYQIRLASKYEGNPSKTIWVDKKSYVGMKNERFSSDGRLTMSTEYTKINYSDRPSSSSFEIPKGWQTVQLAGTDDSLEGVRKQVGFTPIKPGYVPKGYTFGGYSIQQSPGGALFAGLRYTNGLNTISVFERNKDCGGRGFGRGRGRGWMHGRGGKGSDECMLYDPQTRMMRTTAGDITVILVGDIAQTEMQKMADSIK